MSAISKKMVYFVLGLILFLTAMVPTMQPMQDATPDSFAGADRASGAVVPQASIMLVEPDPLGDELLGRFMLLVVFGMVGVVGLAAVLLRMPHWGEKPAARRLLDMPDLVQRIDGMLIDAKQQGGGKNVIASLKSLLLDERQGQRQGFDYNVYGDLIRLHDAVCAGKKVESCAAVLVA